MSSTTLRLAVIIGSVREGRFGPVVAKWFAERARAHGGFEVDVIDLADYRLPHELPAVPLVMDPSPARPGQGDELAARLAAADAFVVVTPDINRSFPASLKTAIDWHFSEWDRKTVGFVGYSGKSGGLLAIEGLRAVFNELNAHTVKDYVSFSRYFLLFDESGALREPAEYEDAATRLLDQLRWWATALSSARAAAIAA
ncbi:NADPH-dependent oxidoreductase [Nocardia yunnanensis]|uniref:NADPH-dependent oxidoreductase n=1 Tax=Nocardia yunnanensis TaxID=2382165 RepID=A0A386ZHK2_9NOCA|nr:NAD(P)H-dependent oxidoreductase [Nocardia yunnanensis]AYF77402.1 NADPH-dependent oxidoreductase [Nocardia yunnanensis]